MDVEVDLQLSIFDFLISGALIWGIYKGYMQGFIVQTIALFALLAGVFVSAKLAMGFYNVLIDKSTVPLKNLPVIAFSLLFGVVIFGANWVALFVKKQVEPVRVNLYSRVFGAFFGALKYLFIASIILIFVDRIDRSFEIRTQKERDRTILYQPVLKFAPTVIPKLRFEISQPQAEELPEITIEPEEFEN